MNLFLADFMPQQDYLPEAFADAGVALAVIIVIIAFSSIRSSKGQYFWYTLYFIISLLLVTGLVFYILELLSIGSPSFYYAGTRLLTTSAISGGFVFLASSIAHIYDHSIK